MAEVDVDQAKTDLSRLLERVAQGEEILISLAGRPVARLVSVEKCKPRQLGLDRGLFEVPDDFDAPLSAAELRAFEEG
jgi:prevent-host-death family protein